MATERDMNSIQGASAILYPVAEQDEILLTKLFFPRLRASYVLRAPLLRRLDADAPFTLVIAPAGFGNTTLRYAYEMLATIAFFRSW